ncbi:MAG: 2Fe-2S iron-sulfur cluster binding domain-containing protein, partial [Candidatus Competibacteraceae bacterium]|nr:2Fe-2S iron-sulfur cluster binding domain-containing protein [Candidatus Competibacteraceae bacterium]
MVKHLISIDNTGETFHCAEDVNILAAMEKSLCYGIPVGCRNGGCGACK